MVPTISESLILHTVLSPVASVCVRDWRRMLFWWWGMRPPDYVWVLVLAHVTLCPTSGAASGEFMTNPLCWGPHVSAHGLSSILALAGTTDPQVKSVPDLGWSPTAPVVGTPHPSTQQPRHCPLAASVKYPVERVCACWGFPRRVHSHWPENYSKPFLSLSKVIWWKS